MTFLNKCLNCCNILNDLDPDWNPSKIYAGWSTFRTGTRLAMVRPIRADLTGLTIANLVPEAFRAKFTPRFTLFDDVFFFFATFGNKNA